MVFGHHHRSPPDSSLKNRDHLARVVGSYERADELIAMHAIRFSPPPLDAVDYIALAVVVLVVLAMGGAVWFVIMLAVP